MASGALNAYLDWPGLGQVFRVDSWVTEKGKTTHEVRYGITSLRGWEADAAELLRYVRGHWGIENRLHWVLDVAFREDQSRTRTGNAQENLAWLRRVTLSLLRQDKSPGSIKRKRKRAARNNAFLEQLLVSMSET